jgi:protein-disulfide isomerase
MTQAQRLVVLAGAVVAAAIAVVALALLHHSPSQRAPAAALASGYLTGVPQHGLVLGRPSAPATLLLFEDPQCTYCGEFAQEAFPSLVTRFVRTGELKLRWRGVAIIGPNSVDGLRAAYAAGAQDRLWNIVDALYRSQSAENSGWITTSLLRSIAPSADVDAKRMLSGMNGSGVEGQLRSAVADARRYSIQGTPSFVLLRAGSAPERLQPASYAPASFDATVAAALR